jgi:hypothetical protein
MKKSVYIFLICILSLLNFPGATVYAQDEPAPLVSKDPTGFSWDFGVVKQGQVLQHDFIIKNESTRELNIKEVNTSCGCTVSKVKDKTLKPQESTVIEVKFNSKGYSGKVKQYVFVRTDSLDNPVLRYIISAEIVK